MPGDRRGMDVVFPLTGGNIMRCFGMVIMGPGGRSGHVTTDRALLPRKAVETVKLHKDV
jgi:hypothetical protein